ncbi:hypothetical protein QBC40DRAFT_281205 [Triangularia verruculosa]|uniref:Apple domain-containing protein n=1 Tax=Triangularia verruculosa TaxID=2587418 RepID=A0AAN7AV77_9PEZI|nr:hypothetical protein QBC40DRAFT_281205 [Triangularia verruculosa]
MTTSPSQSPGPGDRPVSDILDSPTARSSPPPPPPRKEFKAYGQDYQYAETWSNPLPEFIIQNPGTKSDHPGALEAGTVGVTGGIGATTGAGPDSESIDGTQDTSASMDYHERASQHRPDTVGSKASIMREAVWVPPYEKPWYRKLTNLQWLIGTVTLLGVLAVVLAILGAMGILTGTAGTESTSHAANNTSSSSSTSTSTTSSSSARPTQTNIDNFCKDSSSFLKNVGVYNTKVDGSVSTFDTPYDSANSPEDCCNSCFKTSNCAGWMHTGADFTPCTLFVLNTDFAGSENKDQCPKGQANKINFSRANEDNVAARGPCSNDFSFS